ncbi:MAG: hypothetical protein ACRCUE_21425 [Bosea sp. (in: a-proteobacteria)]
MGEIIARSDAAPWGAGTLLPHLAREAAPVRQVIAAYTLAEFAHIVEIGGAGLPLTQFLHHHPLSVTVIDPKIEPYEADMLNGRPCRVRHIERKLLDEDADLVRAGLGVALLGLSLKPFGSGKAISPALVRLCAEAERVVIEHPVSVERSVGQLPELLEAAGLVEIWGVDLVLRDAVITASGHDRRRLSVMRSARAS